LNLRRSVFDFGDVKLVRRLPVCKPFSSRFGHHQPMNRDQESLFINTFLPQLVLRPRAFFSRKYAGEKYFLEKVNIVNIILQLNLGY
jgi:hypothetical protein